MFCCCPCPEDGASGGLTGRVCGIAGDTGSGPPEEASGPLPEGTGRASHRMWPTRGTRRPPPRGRGRSPTPLTVRPSAGSRAPSTPPSEAARGPGAQRGRAQRLQSEKASSAGIPWDSLGCFQSPDAHITRLAMGAGPRDPLKGNRDLSLLSQRHRPAGYWPAHWADRTSVPAGPPAPGTHVPPPQPEPPPPRAPAPAWALAGEPESGHELPPLQGEPALAPAQDPMPMMTDSPLQGEQAPALDRELALSGNTSSRGVVGSAASIPVCSPWMPSTHSPPRGD
ncbi:proline-rich protein 2-like isoform X2 [Cervus canadensis]|uniref:proline-rich protein 2-like isoform X2 n=2 Tax=Cervus canadensis TaxID=1574408 RepID=UPI001CA373AA|nr:proline-rich protein 2-like isoform X2 [Cervus canadensis]